MAPHVKTEKTKMNEKELMALCRLINDEEGATLTRLTGKFILHMKEDPNTREWISAQPEISSYGKVRGVLNQLRWEEIETGLLTLLEGRGSHFDIEEALYLLSRFSGSIRSRDRISKPLDVMAEDLTFAFRSVKDPENVIRMFVGYLFKAQGFHGNLSNYYDPENSFIHKVLERKTGIPISLSCVCLLLARRVQWRGKPLPLYGIGLPSHFIVQFRFPGKHVFIDPFNRGKTLSRQDCIDLLHSQDIDFQESYLLPVNSRSILSRTITNLVHIYTDLGKDEERDQLLSFLQILKEQ